MARDLDYSKAGSGYQSVNRPDIQGSNLGRVLPRQNSTGSLRGTQTVGYGNTKIDGSNNVIQVGDSILLDGNNSVIQVTSDDNSSIGMGEIPDRPGEFGFFSTNSRGQVIMTIVNGTLIMNDTTTDRVLLGQDEGAFS